MADFPKKKVIVLGAGVVGLTTAIKVQEHGQYDVTVIAEVLPTDPKDIKYTSHWAGAHHVLNITEAESQQKMDIETFKVMWELSEPGSDTEDYFLRLPQTELFCRHMYPSFEGFPDHKFLAPETLPSGVVHGVSFTTLTIDAPKYLPYLASRFTSKGGRLFKGTVQHIQQVLEGGEYLFTKEGAPATPDAVVVCTGLGTRFLGGVEDKNMYPTRGQTVVVRAPWVKFGITIADEIGQLTYVIPRKSGDIVLGGIADADDWYPCPRPETTRDILERNLKLCPELAPPEIRQERAPTIEDVLPLVIGEDCGLRPSRKGGVRLEVERLEAGTSGQMVPVVFNYGHGGYGFQSSWGSANIALELLEEALESTKVLYVATEHESKD